MKNVSTKSTYACLRMMRFKIEINFDMKDLTLDFSQKINIFFMQEFL